MRLIKGLIALAIGAALLMVPAGALAKRDRDHDRMPDKWEKRHHLNVHANDARRDPDGDHLSNLSEFRHHTDPQKADTDNDGVDDENELRDDTNPRSDDSDDDGVDDANEISGTVVSFANGVLTIQRAAEGGGTVAGTVNDATDIECENDDAPTATASHDGGDRSGSGDGDSGSGDSGSGDSGSGDSGGDNSGSGSTSSGGSDDGANDDAGDDHGADDQNENENENEDHCTTADLTAGARVHEAKLVKATDGSNAFTKIELVPAA